MTWETTQQRYPATGRAVPAVHMVVRNGSVDLRAGPETADPADFSQWGPVETYAPGNYALSVGGFAVLITPSAGAEYIFTRDYHNV